MGLDNFDKKYGHLTYKIIRSSGVWFVTLWAPAGQRWSSRGVDLEKVLGYLDRKYEEDQ